MRAIYILIYKLYVNARIDLKKTTTTKHKHKIAHNCATWINNNYYNHNHKKNKIFNFFFKCSMMAIYNK